METRANYIAVGLLALIVILFGFVFVYWVGNYGRGVDSRLLDVKIRGSVSGLSSDSIVQFNGIRAGRIMDLRLDESDPGNVIVRLLIDGDIPVRDDTRASVGIRGLSGSAFIQLEGGSPDGVRILEGTSDVIPVLEGHPSSVNELISRVNSMASRADGIMDSLEDIVVENRDDIRSTIRNVSVFSEALSSNSSGIENFLSSTEQLATTLTGLSSRLDSTMNRVDLILDSVDPAVISKSLDDLSVAISSGRSLLESINPSDLQSLISDLRVASVSLSQLFDSLDVEQIGVAVDRFSAVAEIGEGIALDIDGVTSRLGERTDVIDGAVVDAGRLVSRLVLVSEKIDILVDRIDSFVGDLERNPESLLLGGGSSVPESGGLR